MYETWMVWFENSERGIIRAAQFMAELVRQGVQFRTETDVLDDSIKVYFTGGF